MRLGTRGSALALVQAEHVAQLLGGAEVVAVKAPDGAVALDKERFVRGVDEAVLEGDADIGVHSAKDLPGQRPPELRLVGVPAREDPADAFVGDAGALEDVPTGARVGTSSLRRASQLLAARSDIEIVEVRGNVDTRLRKLAAGEVDALVLAAAGLARLGREAEIAFRFGLETMTPAAGQGSLALEARRDDDEAAKVASAITDRAAILELTAERAATLTLGATCDTSVGVCARLDGDELVVLGYAGHPDGSEWVRDRVSGDPEQPAALGEGLAERMLSAGAGRLLSVR